MKVFKKHSNIFITILLFSSLIIVTYFNYKMKDKYSDEEEFHDASSNKVDASSNRVDASSNRVNTNTRAPSWDSPEATTEDVVYAILLIVCPVISVLSLVFFIYTYTNNKPSYISAAISVCFLIFFMMIYFNKYT